jgi:hypothetical protein
MSEAKLTGGCLCGAVRYETTARVFHKTICHCPSCRRAAGAPCVAWFSVVAGDLHFTAGTPAAYQSSAHVTRTFCATCGTALTYRRDDVADEIDVTTCSLDDPASITPDDHTFAAYRLAWLKTDDGLPAYAGIRSAS